MLLRAPESVLLWKPNLAERIRTCTFYSFSRQRITTRLDMYRRGLAPDTIRTILARNLEPVVATNWRPAAKWTCTIEFHNTRRRTGRFVVAP